VITFLRKRLVASLLAMLLVTVIVFVLARLQGDPRVIYTDENLSQETYDALGRELGLDRPIWYQYWVFVSKLAQGDLGVSIHQHRPVFDIVLERLPATLKLAAAAFVFSLVVGVPLGILSAVRRGTGWDVAGRAFAVFGHSSPRPPPSRTRFQRSQQSSLPPGLVRAGQRAGSTNCRCY
jgi:peptide/nickel transport system permease protein